MVTFPWGAAVSAKSSMRWDCMARMSFERRELYFYSSRRVGKPLYIDINELIITDPKKH